MIVIIAGTYGMREEERVIPITRESGPVQLDPETERRLVEEGIAEFVRDSPRMEEIVHETEPDLPEYSSSMRLADLKNIAKAYGIDVSGMTKKAEIFEAIEEAKLEEAVEDGEIPPELDAEEVEDGV
jgi:hypothetical protein